MAAATDNVEEYEPLTPELVEEEAIRGDFVLRWSVVLLAFLLGSTRIAETSALLHVKTGQYLAGNGVLPPAHDVFSYTADDRPWTNLAWGFDLLAAGIHAVGSFAGLSVFKALLVAVVFLLISLVSRPGIPSWWGSVCGLGALLAIHLRIAADPTLVTYVGLALALVVMHQWRESTTTSATESGVKRLWLFVPLMVVWSNLDGWAWLGLVYLLLFAVGDSLGAWLKSPTALPAQARRELWKVAGTSVAATLLHPFGWKSLAAPWFAYGVEYPAFRDYISETWLGLANEPAGQTLIYFPMTTDSFWTHLDLASIAALVVLVAAGFTFALNHARHDWGHLAVYVGFVVLAVVCLHELPAAAIVACVLATLNGQAWYAANCRQAYSIERRDLLLSQGGRALTVLVLAAIAFFGGTGKLRDSTGSPARTGYGLDPVLEMQLTDLQKQLARDASFDDHPFNVRLTQGDQLIWVDEKVFADSRVAVYYAPDEADNLLARHLLTREALRPGGNPAAVVGAARGDWEKTFNKYHITHVVLRVHRLNRDDYNFLGQLLQDPLHWVWTGLGPTAAVFYRNADAKKDPELARYVESHKIDFRKRAFHGGEGEGQRLVVGGRSRGIRPASFYQKWFWTKRHESPAEIHEALHLAVISASPAALPDYVTVSRMAMVHLAIRLAQAGLEKDPDDMLGYLALGQAYDLLSKFEAFAAANGSRSPRSGMRYLQSVSAYNQALVGDPANRSANLALVQIYSEAQKPDLALRHMVAYEESVAADFDMDPRDVEKLEKQVNQLRKSLEQTANEVTARAGAERVPAKMIEGYLQRQCLLRALAEIESAGAAMAGNPGVEQLRLGLLLEAGRIEEAYEASGRFAAAAEQMRLSDWVDIVAMISLIYGDYSGAVSRLQTAADEADSQAFNGLLLNLPPHAAREAWPFSTTKSLVATLYQFPETIAGLRMSVALVHLEQGNVELAARFFRDVLTTFPDTIHRPLIAYYLRELTDGKETIDSESPSNRITELFAPEPDDAAAVPDE